MLNFAIEMYSKNRLSLISSITIQRFVVILYSLCLLLSQYHIRAAPSQYCVEESKDRKIVGGDKPYNEETVKDARQCIASCVKDARVGTQCRAAVFSEIGNKCQKYARTAKESGAQLGKTQQIDTAAYYEVLDKCPSGKVMSSVTDEKRRDPAINEHQISSDSHAFAQKNNNNNNGIFENNAPPMLAHDPGAYGGQQQQYGSGGGGMPTYQVRPMVQTYGGGGSSCCQPPQITICCQVQVQVVQQPAQPCCPAPQPAQCCPAPQPQPCCPAPQPAPCCPAPQPQCCPAPNPEWGPWSAWSECKQLPCSPSGGGGTAQTRTRQCQGYGCIGDAQQQQPCGCLQGQWTEWTPPGTCSVTCGGGTQTRTRSCTVPDTCQGPSTDQQACGQGSCAQWAEWGAYEACSSSCGKGEQARKRQCVDFQGGSAQGCPGEPVDHKECPSLPPCCQEWTPWSSCSSTCGQGQQTRTKTCEGQPPQTEQQPCAQPTPCCSEWSQWSMCQAVCGQGYQTRTRTCGNSGGGGYNGISTALGIPTTNGGGGGGGCCPPTQQQQACTAGCSYNQPQYGYYYRRSKRLA